MKNKKLFEALSNIDNHIEAINDFARSKCTEYMEKEYGGKIAYSYEDYYYIKSEKKLKVNYLYGAGSLVFEGSFYIELE